MRGERPTTTRMLHQLESVSTHDDGVRIGDALQPCRDVRCRTESEVLLCRSRAELAGDDRACVNPDAQRELALRVEAPVQRRDGVEDAKAGIHCPAGVIFMGEGIAK